MFKTSLYISLKQSDLVALSALDTLNKILNIHEITSLKRYKHLKMTSAANIQVSFESYKQHLFFLFNPNKEILNFDAPKLEKNQCAVTVASKYPPKEHPYCTRLTAIYNDPSIQLSEETLWIFTAKENAPINSIVENTLYSESFKKGLFANPITETAQFSTL